MGYTLQGGTQGTTTGGDYYYGPSTFTVSTADFDLPENLEVVFEDEATPLADASAVLALEEEEEIVIEDEETPLGDAPQTGDKENAMGFLALMMASFAGLVASRKRFN